MRHPAIVHAWANSHASLTKPVPATSKPPRNCGRWSIWNSVNSPPIEWPVKPRATPYNPPRSFTKLGFVSSAQIRRGFKVAPISKQKFASIASPSAKIRGGAAANGS